MISRSAWLAVLLWVGLVAAGSAVTWTVIDAAGQQVLSGAATPVVGRPEAPAGSTGASAPTTAASPSATPTRPHRHRHQPRHRHPSSPGTGAAASPVPAAPGTTAPAAPPPAAALSTAPRPHRHHHTNSPSPAPSYPSPTASSSPAPSSTVTRAWHGTGGSVVASCTGADVRLDSATPADGYSVETGDRGPESVEVAFRSPSREVQVTARCSGGTPRFSVESESREGDGGGADD